MKKGISPLIAWILLVGFTIATAAFVTNFIIEETRKQTEAFEFLDAGYCEGVNLDLKSICKISVSPCQEGSPTKLKLELQNKGSFTIRGIAINVLDYDYKGGVLGSNKHNINLIPGGYIFFETGKICLKSSDNEVKLIPSMNTTGKEQFCSENALILRDDVLLSILPCS